MDGRAAELGMLEEQEVDGLVLVDKEEIEEFGPQSQELTLVLHTGDYNLFLEYWHH